MRRLLSAQHKRDNLLPDIQVVRYIREGDRSLVLQYQKQRGRPLAVDDAREVLKHLGRLWGFAVRLESVGENGGVDDCLECAA